MINKKPFDLNGREEDRSYHGLMAYLSGFMPMSGEFTEWFAANCPKPVTYDKATVVLKPGEVAQMAYWPVKGHARAYTRFMREADREFFEQQTIDISLPGRLYLPLDSFMNQVPSDYYLEIAKGSTMIEFSYASFMELGRQMPEVFVLGNRIIAAAERDWLRKIAMYKIFHAPGYAFFLNYFSNSVERYIAIKDIASYLGIRPDQLSKVRGRWRGC